MNTRLIIGAIIGLLIIGSINQAKAWPGVNCYTGGVAYRGQGACGFYGPTRVYGGCYGGGYYGGGYCGGGWNSYGVAQTAVTLAGVASIIGAVTPILQQPVQVVQQPQVVYIIQPSK